MNLLFRILFLSLPFSGFSHEISRYIDGKVNLDRGDQPKRFIITGAPSAGKTSIIKTLEKAGHAVIHEVAEIIIGEDKKAGIEQPWDQQTFESKVIALQKEWQEKSIQFGDQTVFFDRSPIDAVSYCIRLGHEFTLSMKNTVQEIIDSGFYSDTVFLIEHLGECENNGIRHELVEECLVIEKQLIENYEALGFHIVRIPKESIKNRTQMVLDYILLSNK